MRIILQQQVFEAEPSAPVPPAIVQKLEEHFAWNDSRLLPLMAGVRKATKFGQIPDLLDRFKIPYEV